MAINLLWILPGIPVILEIPDVEDKKIPLGPEHSFSPPRVVELHIVRTEGVPEGTLRLMWLLRELFKEESDV